MAEFFEALRDKIEKQKSTALDTAKNTIQNSATSAANSVKATVPKITSSIFPTKQVAQPQPQATSGFADMQALRQQMADKSMEATRRRFKDAFNQTNTALQQEQGAADVQNRNQYGQTMTQDAMNRARSQKLQGVQGLDGGSAAQSDISQNVLTQGATSALQQQKALSDADIRRRQSLASEAMNQGIADAQAETDLTLLTQQLQDMENQQGQEKEDYLTTMGRFSGDYQAEINKVQGDNDPTNDWQVPYLQAARQQKIDTYNLDPTTGKPLDTVAEVSAGTALKLWEQLGTANESVAQSLGIPVGTRYTSAVASSIGGGSGGSGTTRTSTAKPEGDLSNASLGATAQAVQQQISDLKDAMTRSRMSQSGALEYLQSNYNDLINNPAFGKEAVDNVISEYTPAARTEVGDVNKHVSLIDNMFVTPAKTTSTGVVIEPEQINKDGVTEYLRNLFLDKVIDAATADMLLERYGL